MFDFGFWELAIVLVVALLVVGPEKLPILAAKAGRFIGKAKVLVQSVRADIETEIRAAEMQEMLQKQQSEISELRSILDETKSNVENEIQSLADDGDHSINDDVLDSDMSSSNQDENPSKTD